MPPVPPPGELDDGVEVPHGNGQFLGDYKPNGSLCCGVYTRLGIIQSSTTACSERDHSVLNNSTTCDAALVQNSLTACLFWLREPDYLYQRVPNSIGKLLTSKPTSLLWYLCDIVMLKADFVHICNAFVMS